MPPQSLREVYEERYAGDYRQELEGYEVARWKALEHYLLNVAKVSDAKLVLDYGAGAGLHVDLWRQAFPQADLYGCDISSTAGEKCVAKYPHLTGRYRRIDNDRVDFPDEMFDVILSIEVMEHVEDLEAYLREIYRLLKPGGKFIWTTPCGNFGSIDHLYSVLAGKTESARDDTRRFTWEDPTHLRRLKSGQARRFIQNAGFREAFFRYRAHLFSFLCTYVIRSRPYRLRHWLMTLDYRLFRLLPNASSMIGCATK